MKAAQRIGLVGCGRWGCHILRDLLHLGCTTIVADPSSRAGAQAREAGAAETVSSAAELPAVDGIIIASPTTTHAAVVHAVAARGVPIFCEKPLTADLASAKALAAALRGPLFVMDKWRYHPGIECLRDLVRTEALGPVLGLRTTRFGWENAHHDVDAVWILAPHDLSIALEVLGALPTPLAAVAERSGEEVTGLTAILGPSFGFPLPTGEACPERRRRGQGEGDDIDQVRRLDLVAAYAAILGSPSPHSSPGGRGSLGLPLPMGEGGGEGEDPWMLLDVSTRNGQRRRSAELHCRDGIALLADAYADHVSIVRHAARPGLTPESLERVPITGELPLLRELGSFVEFLSGGVPPRSTLADGLRIVRTLATLRAQAGIAVAVKGIADGDAAWSD